MHSIRSATKPIAATLAAFAFIVLVSTTQQASAQLLWSDEFDSGTTPDSAIWSHDLGATRWGNQELQEYTDSADNARIENGELVIAVRQKAGRSGFTSARLRTENKLMFRYGTIEARIRMPDLQNGLWPAFWTLGNDFSQVGWPDCGELDIMEMGWLGAVDDGLVNRWVGSAAHWERQGGHAQSAREYSPQLVAPANLNDDHHLFRMEWTPDAFTTFLDEQQLWTMDIGLGNCSDCQELHQPHFIILNVAVGGSYTGLLDSDQISAPMPAEMKVDYVRIYDNGHTELSGSGLSTEPVGMSDGDNFGSTPSDFTATARSHTAIDTPPLIKPLGVPAPASFSPMAR